MSSEPSFLGGYPQDFVDRALDARAAGTLEAAVLARHTEPHGITDNGRLNDYVQELKRAHMKHAPPLSKVRYCEKIRTLHRALGLHTYAVRVQGANLKRKHELRVARLFRDLPADFLEMIVVHELAHLRHRDHDRAFYRLCEHMMPDYHRVELDLRLVLFARQPR